MAASQLWYVPYRPDLVLLAPCDEEGPLPCPGCMYVSVDHLHPPPERPEAASRWRHPRATPFLTCFGDIAQQQPRVVRCACGASPCRLRGLSERGAVPDELIPTDWATKYELPPRDNASTAPEGRRASAVQLWLECTAKAEKELPRRVGDEQPPEEAVLRAAEMMLTDYLKGRVCFNCSVPSTRMQKCARCLQARYCSKECQRANWGTHKAECKPLPTDAAAGAKVAATPVTAAAAESEAEKAMMAEAAAPSSAT